jgi:endonuclease/exonuclease/phosphatase family metal-dependent hydrolase
MLDSFIEPLEARWLLSSERPFSVMTQNLYLGGDINPAAAIVSGNPTAIVTEVTKLWASVRATNFNERAVAIANEVAATQPTLIGLQEAETWRTGPFNGPGIPATNVEYDYIPTLLNALAAKGLHYEVVAESTNFDAEAPGFTAPGVLQDIRITDHDAILARTDLPVSQLQLSNATAQQFAAVLHLGPIALPRSYVSVDAQIRGKSFRFITTHLDPISPVIQVAQADELLSGPADTDLPVVMAGDFNSNADNSSTASYSHLIGGGFVDAWSATRSDVGNTCCQAADLRNAVSELDHRIDLVLFRGEDIEPEGASLIGDQVADKTPSGLWPSDHAGVIGQLALHVRPALDATWGNFGGTGFHVRDVIQDVLEEVPSFPVA